ncbi:nucleotidyltransferase family protein [Stieleria neptunia]|uniref:nucleotidyltransferase family protein n=1 Tax=Stieleria neptunia TaxID=2527979 RepID=UPI00119F630B|nr:nucleotidyltransferase family protein [Stieleria neptunia]
MTTGTNRVLIKDVVVSDISTRLRNEGLGFRFGPYQFRVRSDLNIIAEAIHVVQAHRAFRPPEDLPDFTLDFQAGSERFHRAIICSVDGVIWRTWPRRLSVAAMEWVTSWCFFRQSYNHLAFHAAAAVVPGTDQTIVFPGNSGAGKSTLASTLMLSGWKLLSDETALFDLEDQRVYGLGRPTILKGHSLDLIESRFGDRAVFGPRERILDPPSAIAHLRPTPESVSAVGSTFPIGAFVLPSRSSDPSTPCQLERLSIDESFVHLTQLGINFRMMGRRGFDDTIHLARTVPAYRLHYHDAGDAERFLREQNLFSSASPAVVKEPVSAAEQRSAVEVVGASNENARSSQVIVSSGDAKKLETERDPAELLRLVNRLREDASICREWDLRTWDRVIRFANHTSSLAQISHDLHCGGLVEYLPVGVRARLQRENWLTAFNHRIIRYETAAVGRILAPLQVPLVLLKGSAYLTAGCEWAAGRTTNDIDLLVREQDLDDVDRALRRNEFAPNEYNSDRDERYYRRWLHELAPRSHVYRHIEIDLHFRLLPFGDPYSFPVDGMIDRSRPIPGTPYSWLDPVDCVLNSIVNLGHTGEYRRAFRDLWDLRYLVESSGGETPFDWEALSSRTERYGLAKTVGNVLALAAELVGLELPPGWMEQTTGASIESIRSRRLYRMMRTASIPDGRAYRSRRRRTAIWFLEHYPLPKIRTWLDPLTWTKRVKFIQGG